MRRPTLTIVAGPNGAGKSTLTAGNLGIFGSVPVLDPDSFANILHPSGVGTAAIAAAKQVIRLGNEHVKSRESFAVETTLSGKNYLRLMQYARGLNEGFEIVLIYIGTESVEINLARIAKRVMAGGHNVPDGDVRRRYVRSLENLFRASEIADQVLLFDNSTEVGFEPVGLIGRSGVDLRGAQRWFEPLPQWAADLRKRFP